MFKSTLKCPLCGRPFVNLSYLDDHQPECAARKQAALDHEWERSRQPETQGKRMEGSR
jgi:hypothetical protein